MRAFATGSLPTIAMTSMAAATATITECNPCSATRCARPGARCRALEKVSPLLNRCRAIPAPSSAPSVCTILSVTVNRSLNVATRRWIAEFVAIFAPEGSAWGDPVAKVGPPARVAQKGPLQRHEPGLSGRLADTKSDPRRQSPKKVPYHAVDPA